MYPLFQEFFVLTYQGSFIKQYLNHYIHFPIPVFGLLIGWLLVVLHGLTSTVISESGQNLVCSVKNLKYGDTQQHHLLSLKHLIQDLITFTLILQVHYHFLRDVCTFLPVLIISLDGRKWFQFQTWLQTQSLMPWSVVEFPHLECYLQ